MQVLFLTAGLGTRLRPHTFTKPKTLVSLAGKPMLAHVLDSLNGLHIDEMVVVTGYLGNQVEAYMRENYTFPLRFIEQPKAQGQAHAVHLCRDYVDGPLLIVFSDGIFAADMAKLNTPPEDALIYVQQVPDPSRFGVVVLDENGYITQQVEKPKEFVSNLANIGVYYVPSAKRLLSAIDHIMENNITLKGEFFLVDAFRVMMERGEKFRSEEVEIWKDCGTIPFLLDTNRYLLENGRAHFTETSATRSVIIPPVYIADSAQIEDSVIGPYVSIAENVKIHGSRLEDSIINAGATVESISLRNSLVGNDADVSGKFQEINIGDSSAVSF